MDQQENARQLLAAFESVFMAYARHRSGHGFASVVTAWERLYERWMALHRRPFNHPETVAAFTDMFERLVRQSEQETGYAPLQSIAAAFNVRNPPLALQHWLDARVSLTRRMLRAQRGIGALAAIGNREQPYVRMPRDLYELLYPVILQHTKDWW